jgi:hypothetical protein
MGVLRGLIAEFQIGIIHEFMLRPTVQLALRSRGHPAILRFSLYSSFTLLTCPSLPLFRDQLDLPVMLMLTLLMDLVEMGCLAFF